MAVKRTAKFSSIENRIRPVGEADSYLKMLCYGKAGTGKTVFGASFPKPLLLLDIREKGHESVSDVKGVDLLQVEQWPDLEEAYWMLKNGSKYKAVIVDQLTAMQALAIDKVRQDKGMKPGETISQRSWGQVSGMMSTWIYNFRELENLHICFNAHERQRDAEETEDDRIAPSVGSNLMQSVASFVNGAVSVIGNTFIRERYEKKTKERSVEFCMRVGPHAFYAAKIRRPVSAGPAPDVIVNPTFDKVMSISRGESLSRKIKRK